MDANDAKLIAKNIDDIYNHSSNAVILIKKQTTLVQNLISQLETYKSMNNKNIAQIKNFSNQSVSFNNLMLENIFNTKNNLDVLQLHTLAIENSIQVDSTKLISPLIITPKNFIKSLETMKDKEGDYILFALQLSNYHVFLRLSTIKIYLYNNRIIYKISTPIPDKNEYILYKLTSVPTATWTQYFIYSNLDTTYVALSKDNSEYTIISYDECKIMNEHYYCKNTRPVLRSSTTSCLSELM